MFSTNCADPFVCDLSGCCAIVVVVVVLVVVILNSKGIFESLIATNLLELGTPHELAANATTKIKFALSNVNLIFVFMILDLANFRLMTCD